MTGNWRAARPATMRFQLAASESLSTSRQYSKSDPQPSAKRTLRVSSSARWATSSTHTCRCRSARSETRETRSVSESAAASASRFVSMLLYSTRACTIRTHWLSTSAISLNHDKDSSCDKSDIDRSARVVHTMVTLPIAALAVPEQACRHGCLAESVDALSRAPQPPEGSAINRSSGLTARRGALRMTTAARSPGEGPAPRPASRA